MRNTNYILDQISEITKKSGKFSEKLQSNYKVTLENHNIGNFQIIKSEYKHLEDIIELELEYNWEIIKINRKIDTTSPEWSIYMMSCL